MLQALTAIFYREYKIRTTNLVWLLFDMLVPLMYLLVFGLGFSRAIGPRFTVSGQPIEYNSFFVGGVLAMASFGVAMNTTWSWFMDRDHGIFYEMLTYPMTRRQHLMGKVSFNVLVAMLEAVLVVLGAAFLLNLSLVWWRLPVVLLAVGVGTAGWFFFFSIFALQIRRNDIYHTVINMLYFGLLFGSNMFYPLEPMPGWLKWTALVNPVTWQVNVLRYATIDLAERQVLADCGLFSLFTILSLLWATWALRRQE